MSEQRRVTLPNCLMKAAKVIGESDMAPVERLNAIVLMTHGYGLIDAHPGILDTTAMAIPESQWAEICEILMHLSNGSDIDRVNLGLDWMNVGPSGYKD